ncbi:MAG: VOC family protein [Hyphomicrobiales bacterium]|nr:VOC family protein [Hyphomicrobiales bacterium]
MQVRDFVWYELTTPDKAAAEAFYGDVVGWTMADSGMPGGVYTLAKVGERPVVGVMQPAPGCDDADRFGWLGHVGVDDVDETAARMTASGGRLLFGPMSVEGVGRFAVVADPQGAPLGLFAPTYETTPLPTMSPGSIGWHELLTADPVAAFAGYAALFGWRKDQTYPMPGLGDYQLFASDRGAIGGMMKNPHGDRAFWGYYFAVDDIDAAIERTKAGGGAIVNGPMEVPGGAFIVQANDPQGLYFALVGPRR